MKMHPVLKIILLFTLLGFVCFFGILGGIAALLECEYASEPIAYVIIGIVALLTSAILIVFSVRSLIKAFKQLRSSQRHSIRYKEKCFKKIDKLHRYCESGSITQEEFEAIKQEILNSIE